MPRLLISIVEGRLVRDLFENGLLDYLNSSGIDVSVLSPASGLESFTSRWSRRGVRFITWRMPEETPWQKRARALRKYTGRAFGQFGEEVGYAIERQTSLRPRLQDLRIIDEVEPDLCLATHTLKFDEEPLINAARARGAKTLGLVRSWDNVYKGLRSRPDDLSVWNEVNRGEVIEMEKYRPQCVHITGPAQFDAYFDESGRMDRSNFCETMDLDPLRPILTLATIGQYFPEFDEAYLADLLLKLIQEGRIPRDTQLIIRLHPWSHYEQFHRFARDSRVRISFIHNYVPGLSWMMDRADVIWMGNLLRHSDVVVTPGSTIALETAIFDTPTLVPIFHTTTPEIGKWYFERYVVGKHFRRIRDHQLVAIDDNVQDFVVNLNQALKDRSWYAVERRKLRDLYIPFLDGRCTRRLAELVLTQLGMAANRQLETSSASQMMHAGGVRA